jgi:hypothetical protein
VYKTCSHCGYQASYSANALKCYNCFKLFPTGPSYDPSTQKAKGLVALHKISGQANSPWLYTDLRVLQIQSILKASEELKTQVKNYFPSFCRPCPPSPEHGFVESRVIKDMDELEVLRQETLAANAESEILMTPVYSNVTWNAIWTPKLLTIGPGHDGATAGKDTISFPLVGANPFSSDDLTLAGVAEDKDPYVEVIKPTGDYIQLTQIRSGPKLESGVDPDFIPEEMVVAEVIKTNGEDLLEWAKRVKDLKGKSGVVVWHPGGSLTDHYTVHCRENGVPIITSFQPVEGLVLEPKPMPPLDPQAMIRGLAWGDAENMYPQHTTAGNWVALALMALHNSQALRGQHSFWIGAGVAAVLKLGSAAMAGESRHAHNAWQGFKDKPNLYQHYGKKSLSFHRARLSRVTQLLHYGFGDPDTQPVNKGCGYGGRRWALCGAALAPLFTAVKRLCEEPTEENASQLLLDYNVAVNQCHNGGWWLNKFILVQAYDQVPRGNLGFLMQGAQIIWEGKQHLNFDTSRFLSRVATWPKVTSIAPLRWRKAQLSISPGSLSIALKASTLPKFKEIKIPATAGLMKALVTAVGKIDVKPGEVLLQVPEGDPIVLFRETKLEAVARVHGKE